jgi:SAM-dependent methyltransferase
MATAKRSRAPAARNPPLEGKEFEAWEDWYARQDYRQMPWYSPRPSPWLQRAVRERWIPRGASVLDVGCGSGSNTIWLKRQGFRSVGIDISPTVIAVANARARRAGVPADFRMANAASLPFRNGEFGAALDTGCFHSLPVRLRWRYARGIARVLRTGSPFLLTWIPREVRSSVGPPHRPALAEIASVLEPWFLFVDVERHDTGSRSGWKVNGERFARCTALLIRRRGRQPPPW